MDFQVVVLAGGYSKKLVPLISKEVPKALLPVANRPVLSYVLDLLEQSNLKDLIVVAEGDDAATCIGGWISGAYVDRLQVHVASVPEDIGTSGAIRAIAHRLTAKDILIVSGDLVSEVSPGAVAAVHRRHDAVVTTMLCSNPISGPPESGSGGKDKTKKPKRHNVIGLDSSKQFLLFIATGAELEKDLRLSKSILSAAGEMELRADLMDAHLYAIKRSALLEVLEQKENYHSLKEDVLPYLVWTQLKSKVLPNGVSQVEEKGDDKASSQNKPISQSQILANASSARGFHELYALDTDSSASHQRTHKCCVYIANNSKYCARLDSIQAFSDINRDVTGDANHLSGFSFSAHNNTVHPSAELGSKTTVGPHCVVGEGSKMGDRCSVKRSVIGHHCQIGSNVKIVNSVVMNHVTIGDGCSVQGSVICSDVQLQERAILRDCQVGAGYVVTAGREYKGESLAKNDK